MIRFATLTSVAVVALAGAPAASQEVQNQQNQQNQQSQNQQQQQGALGQQKLSEQGRDCVQRLEEADRQLGELGYGRAGPAGYGVYGTGYSGATTASESSTEVLTRPLEATPRADMQALMRAGYVMARTGYDEGCQQVAEAVQDIGQRYRQAVEAGDIDPDGMARWREGYLANATDVSQLSRPLRADEVIGADLRTPGDEDLGDINDVVIGPNGEIRYVVVSTGGFLGIGDDEVPVPWSTLKVTEEPYRDTFVLDVDEQALEQAPRLEGNRQQLATGDGKIDSYWESQLDDPS